MSTRDLLLGALALAIPAIAFGSSVGTVPEPETLALVAVGAVALIVARWAKRD